MTTETVAVMPRIGTSTRPSGETSLGDASIGKRAMDLDADAVALDGRDSLAKAKAFWSVSNEYWLIGIIIVMITVILMLIVYIVKIKQATPIPSGDKPPPPPGKHATEDKKELPDMDRMRQIANKPFIPRTSEQTGTVAPAPAPAEQDEGDDSAFDEANQSPLFVMDGSAVARAETTGGAVIDEPPVDSDTAAPPSGTDHPEATAPTAGSAGAVPTARSRRGRVRKP